MSVWNFFLLLRLFAQCKFSARLKQTVGTHRNVITRTRVGADIMLACNVCWCDLDSGSAYISQCDHVFCEF